MTAGVAVRPGSNGRGLAMALFVTLVAGLAMAGTAIAIQALATVPEADDHAEAAAVGHPITTTFGSLTVVHAQTIDGLTAEDMWNGMSHGIQSLVQPDEAQVAVSISLANTGDRPIRVDPGQFAVVVEGEAGPVAPTGTTVQPLALQPGSTVDGTLVFVVPLTGASATFSYADPGGPPITMPMGRLDEAPAVAPGHGDEPSHADDPPAGGASTP